ncbi:MAG: hypothetical protein ACM35G_10170 [Planctomycetaceae bacterium]
MRRNPVEAASRYSMARSGPETPKTIPPRAAARISAFNSASDSARRSRLRSGSGFGGATWATVSSRIRPSRSIQRENPLN